MNTKLHVETKCKEEEEDLGEEQPLSPSAEYLNSKALSLCILAILEFEIPMDVVRILPLVEDVFIPISSRFSSIMTTNKEGGRRWKIVKVNMHDHVKIPIYPEGLIINEYDIHFDKYLTKIGIEPLPEDKPLWEIHIFKYPTSKAAGSLIFKLHHSLGDGYSLMGALLSCLQRADDSSLPLTFPSTRRVPEANDSSQRMINVINRVARNICSIYNGVCEFGWSIAKVGWVVDDETPIRSGSQGVGFHPTINISSVDLSLDMLIQVKTKLNVTINAVLTGIIFFAARSYMQDAGQSFRNSRSTVAVLLNTRNVNGYMSIKDMLKTESKMWGNQFAFLHIAFPEIIANHNYSNALDFVFESQKFIKAKKNSPAVYLTGLFLEIVRKCRGSEVAAEYVRGALKNSSIGFTSIIGPVEKMALLDQPVKGLYFMVTGTHLSITITAMSYKRSLRIGIGTELGFIDSVKFKSCIEKAFEVIYDAAMSNTS
ncbi:wax ester synthase/diacylglycerol acyltransferase 4-like isoform X2 [Silene latifolia]|uniref:wax ester synthase/diacylglycerol acyltransferase 4-like isoform X2 n=1 Tax=Silene latifolia TaxID=37657 RepID=UPI003D775E1E